MSAHGLRRVAALAVALVLPAACDRAAGGARVAVVPTVGLQAAAPPGAPLHIEYRWTPDDAFEAPAEDYQVLVHFRASDGTVVFQDDHYPPEPTSQWRRDGEQAYRRWVYPPATLAADALQVVVGLYSSDGRAQVLDARGDWADEVTAHRLVLDAEAPGGAPTYLDGWFPPEGPPEAERPWRWSEGVAHLLFTNPRADSALHLFARAPFGHIGRQTVVVWIGKLEMARFETASGEEFVRRIEIPGGALGIEEWTEMVLSVEPVHVPSRADPNSTDARELGLQVFALYLSPS